ncbi:MAG TPA: asparagine synthase-related protein [Terriglobales bacterium]|nr:asparagine synthase-related protein [Terriglobales bacterium]
MSGIVGIIHFDGAPVDRRLLGQMTGLMAFRGPDAQQVWTEQNVGLGHTLLTTTEESHSERQPFTLDGQVWIVSDARIDERDQLIAHFQAHGHAALDSNATDVELILRAYLQWGEDCVEHLLGDFSFAVWDGRERELFCARDHFGVKPFFYAYARRGAALIFSNTLECVRDHPAVSDRLNDLAIADFLLFDLNQDLATTSFADIQRLPPAHVAVFSAQGMQTRRYWRLPVEEPVFFRRDQDYVDRFLELLEQAVADRLRTRKIGVFMSGGLDSPSLAATACRILREQSIACEGDEDTAGKAVCEVRASTTVIDGFDGNERYFAGLVAEHLRIPIEFQDLTGKVVDAEWDDAGIHTAEPVANPLNLVSDRAAYQTMAGQSRVWFYGEGPDNALRPDWQPYLAYLARQRMFGRLAKTGCDLVWRSRRIPFLRGLLRPWQARWSGQSEQSAFPAWLNRDFATGLKLQERWDEIMRLWSQPSHHPLRPESYRSCQSDAEATGAAAEIRHPFADVRLVRYMMSVPAIPWAREKYLVRRAMRGVLPAAILRRRKSPLSGDPYWDAARRLDWRALCPAPGPEKYIDRVRVPGRVGQDIMSFWTDLRPRALNYWLRNLPCKMHCLEAQQFEEMDEAQLNRGRNGRSTLRAVS